MRGVRHGVSSEVSVEAQLCEAAYAFSRLESSRGSWQFPCSAQAKPKLRTELFRHLVTRAEPLVPRVPPPIPRLFFFWEACRRYFKHLPSLPSLKVIFYHWRYDCD